MTVTAKIHSFDDQGSVKRTAPPPVMLSVLKAETDSERDHVTARLEHVRATRLSDEGAVKRLEQEIERYRDAISAADSEEAELIRVDAILSHKQHDLDRMLVEKR